MAKRENQGHMDTSRPAKAAQTQAYNRAHYGEVIRSRRLGRELSQQQLADRLGVHKNYVTHWEAGRARPDLNLVPALCDALGMSVPAFFGVPGAPDALSREEEGLVSGYRRLAPRDRLLVRSTMDKMLELSADELWERCRTAFIPMLHNVQHAAAGTGFTLDAGTEQVRTFIRRSAAAERADEIVTVNGSSMEPRFHHGQDVFVSHTAELAPGEIGLFVVNGEGFIKEWAGDRLHSLNPEYPDIRLSDGDDARCVGRVLGPVDREDYPTPEELAVLQELERENALQEQ